MRRRRLRRRMRMAVIVIVHWTPDLGAKQRLRQTGKKKGERVGGDGRWRGGAGGGGGREKGGVRRRRRKMWTGRVVRMGSVYSRMGLLSR